MLFWPSIAVCVFIALGVLFLVWLAAIDLKLRLLPDELNLALALAGIGFRWAAAPWAGPWFDPILGVVAGAGALLLVRAVANRVYGFETMGLGDVKLMGAAGVWLGVEGVVMALAVGAFMGLLHGLLVMGLARLKDGRTENFREMTIPAGPGFCAGILLVGIYIYWHLPLFGGA